MRCLRSEIVGNFSHHLVGQLLKAEHLITLFNDCVSWQVKWTLVGEQEILRVNELIPMLQSLFIWIKWHEEGHANRLAL